MIQRYFIRFCFDGTCYHGWQIQPNGISIQEKLQQALSTIFQQKIKVVGAGRTDSGVHARMMVAHFDIEDTVDLKQLVYRLNRILPKDISVFDVSPVNNEANARFSATRRTYHYYVHTKRNPFIRQYSYELHSELDFELMNVAAEILIKTKDFASFCKSNSDAKTTLCNVYEAKWIQKSDTEWFFRISANRFLRNMVRSIVGTLIDVGKKKITIDEFRNILADKNRCSAGESMPGHALFLEQIEYPNSIY